jgi:hypothetical protein
MRARDVLNDCKLALHDFEEALRDFDEALPTPEWRTRWVGLVALLRSVGHVLDKVDGETNAKWRDAVDKAWERVNSVKPDHKILWEFIEQERNNVLKAYNMGARLNTTFRPGPMVLGFSDSTVRQILQKTGPTTHEPFMRSGSYAGRDALALCREAIAFWEKYLSEVEAAATSQSESTGKNGV